MHTETDVEIYLIANISDGTVMRRSILMTPAMLPLQGDTIELSVAGVNMRLHVTGRVWHYRVPDLICKPVGVHSIQSLEAMGFIKK